MEESQIHCIMEMYACRRHFKLNYIWKDCELHLANLANPNTKTKTVPEAQDQDRHSWKHQSTAARSFATTAMPEVGHSSEVVSMRNQSGQPIPE